MPRTDLLLDACIAINLAATDRLRHIAQTLEVTFTLTQQAAAEVGYLRDIINSEPVSTPIDLGQYTGDGTVQVIELDPSEYPLYIELAGIVDDGEAATIAAAALRGLQLATDDRKARTLCAERHIPEPFRTLALMHSYTDDAQLSASQIHDLLAKISSRASFQPARSDPDHKWWHDHLETT